MPRRILAVCTLLLAAQTALSQGSARKKLLADEKNTLSQISFQCGFNDLNYFVRAFKKSEGLTPGAYRESRGRS